jgi:glycosyltransferase involved in cell wall biosynthesis
MTITDDPDILNEGSLPGTFTSMLPGRYDGSLHIWRGEERRREWGDVAVLLPCRNEQVTIGKVVSDFKRALPDATVYVYDNASSDLTADEATRAGAVVRRAPAAGKGNVLRRMFAEIDADVYVLADGDDTYDASVAPELIRRLRDDHLDMLIGLRVESEEARNAYRAGHRLGNRLLSGTVSRLFGHGSRDMLSGYRVLSRRYVKSFPAFSRGFETETEMTVHALDLSLPFDEVPTEYRDRPEESVSKLRTIPDGLRILKFILVLCKDYRPLRFFGSLAAVATLAALISGTAAHGLHAWTPAAFGAGGFAAIAVLSTLAGVILDSLGRSRREMKRVLYLTVASNGGAFERRKAGSAR